MLPKVFSAAKSLVLLAVLLLVVGEPLLDGRIGDNSIL
jgi:hypothetical protein